MVSAAGMYAATEGYLAVASPRNSTAMWAAAWAPRTASHRHVANSHASCRTSSRGLVRGAVTSGVGLEFEAEAEARAAGEAAVGVDGVAVPLGRRPGVSVAAGLPGLASPFEVGWVCPLPWAESPLAALCACSPAPPLECVCCACCPFVAWLAAPELLQDPFPLAAPLLGSASSSSSPSSSSFSTLPVAAAAVMSPGTPPAHSPSPSSCSPFPAVDCRAAKISE